MMLIGTAKTKNDETGRADVDGNTSYWTAYQKNTAIISGRKILCGYLALFPTALPGPEDDLNGTRQLISLSHCW